MALLCKETFKASFITAVYVVSAMQLINYYYTP